jgi:hypothetical protein
MKLCAQHRRRGDRRTSDDEPYCQLATRCFPHHAGCRTEKEAYAPPPKIALPTHATHYREAEGINTCHTTPLHQKTHQICPKMTYTDPSPPTMVTDLPSTVAETMPHHRKRRGGDHRPRKVGRALGHTAAMKASEQGHDAAPGRTP